MAENQFSSSRLYKHIESTQRDVGGNITALVCPSIRLPARRSYVKKTIIKITVAKWILCQHSDRKGTGLIPNVGAFFRSR
ncbi:hypothetical protein DPMN_167698 [Dreissena polymorpha]|uniref:Uncharacterized protein n=1 Tax=Dreissena polymorpha TaxID=45954 RepID=A0A9D4F0R0_DREPO|nr:hypothetical protein DPMN_167698 [Dreissena polymorpha]